MASNDIDTAAIRADMRTHQYRDDNATRRITMALCDALDAARAELVVRHAYSCCDSPRGCAWPDDHTQPCSLHHGCSAHFPGAPILSAEYMAMQERAGAAEAESEALRREQIHAVRLAEAAEARIAAALDIHRPGGCFCIGTHPCATSRALTGTAR